MRLIRFLDDHGTPVYGELRADGQAVVLAGDPFTQLVPTDRITTPGRLLAPVIPRQILCIGLNYRKHAEETKAKIPEHPVLFFKNVNAVQDPGQPIVLPRTLRSDSVDYEGELAVVIGRDARNVSEGQALSYVLGYTVANDVSARDWQKNGGGGQWCRGKSFDTFAPLGPVLVTADRLTDPQALGITTRIGDEVLQDSTTADMIFSVAKIISFLSASTTLPAGTVILTGTPSGVGMARTPQRWLVPGDVVRVTIAGIGTLENPVIEE